MEGSYKVVPAAPEHVPLLPAIERGAGSLFGGDVPAELLEHVTSESDFRASQAGGRLWVALGPDEGPVGYSRVEVAGVRAHLAGLDVLPAHGRRGLGTALVRAAEGWARSSGLSEITLTTYRDVPWNAPFYAGLGFEVVPESDWDADVRRRFEQEAGLDSERAKRVVMHKRLGTVSDASSGRSPWPAGEVSMVQLGDDLIGLRSQLAEGSLQRAYGSIVGYMSRLRSHFAALHGDRAVSALYQGCFDMTYFALFSPALKSRGLKLAIVFDYESFGFEVWLAARNRTVQRRYWQLLRDAGWSAHRLVEPAAGVDAIVEYDVAGAFGLESPDTLTAQIEAAVRSLSDELEAFLAEHDPLEAG